MGLSTWANLWVFLVANLVGWRGGRNRLQDAQPDR